MEALRGEMKRLIYGNFVSQVTCSFAELGVADALSEGRLELAKLAKKIEAKPEFLKRFLRCASDLGLVDFDPGTDEYELKDMGSLLSSSHSQSMREEARLNGAYYRYEPWAHLANIVRKGVDEKYSPTIKSGSLEYLKDKPELLENFHKAMTELSRSENELIIRDYDFSRFSSILDIGSGEGSLLKAIMDKQQQISGYAFDLPETLSANIETRFEGRLELIGGDFFKHIPDTADVYIMKNVIHNWPEDKALLLLKNVRKAMLSEENNKVSPAHKRLLIIENLVPENDDDSIANWMDLTFMVLVDGAERTLNQYRDIASRAGLKLLGSTSTSSGRDIMEFSLA